MGRNHGGRCERVAVRVGTEVPCFHTHSHGKLAESGLMRQS